MTETNTIAAGICDFIREQLTAEGVLVETNTPFEKIGLDSFSLIELVLLLERRWNIKLPDHEMTRENMFNAQTLAACAVKYKN